ncbi:MAG: restriction endonuclease [Sulfuricella denitrificans]|nr:restriction endonuclease [Sulfuricella denitrificans]
MLGDTAIGIIIGIGAISIYLVNDTVKKKKAMDSKKNEMDSKLKALPDFCPTHRIFGWLGQSGLAVDVTRKKVCLITNSDTDVFYRMISYKDILSVELIEDGISTTKTSRLSQSGGAAVGGILLGGVGAIVGGLSGKRETSEKVENIDLRLTVNDTDAPLHTITFLKVPIEKAMSIYAKQNQAARLWYGIIDVLIKSADSENKSLPFSELNEALPSTPVYVDDEIKKLQDLHATSALTADKFQQQKNEEKIRIAKSYITEIINAHLSTLATKHRQSIVTDEYGAVDISGWSKEIDYFVDKVLWADPLVAAYLGGIDTGELVGDALAAITKRQDDFFAQQEKGQKIPQWKLDKLKQHVDDINRKSTERMREAKNLINELVTNYRINEIENPSQHSLIDVDSLDPIQFEHYCADILRNGGWSARVTQASGDQGIDVIATIGNIKAVFQCKKYSQPVGNASVQEIFAGKQHEQAHVAAVVSNATFTSSAKQLASSTGVYLLHYSELDQFSQELYSVITPR